MKITNKQIDKGLREYQYFLNGRSGQFTTLLFEAIEFADRINVNKLAQAFPEYVYAYLDFNGRLSQVEFELEE